MGSLLKLFHSPVSDTPTHLPDALGAPYMAYGMAQLVSDYAGSCIEGRNGALTLENIGFSSSGKVDAAALASNGTIACRTWYDQSGNARHLVNNGTDALPAIDTTVNKYNTFPIIFGADDTVSPPRQNLQTSATLALSRQAISIYIVHNPIHSNANSHLDLRIAGGHGLNCYTVGGQVGLQWQAFESTASYPRAQLSVNAYCADGTGKSLYSRGTRVDLGAPGAATLDQLVLGSDTFGGGFNTCAHMLAYVIYNTKHTPAQSQTVIDALTTIFDVPTAFTSRIIYVGDSIAQGLFARLNVLDQLNVSGAELFNLGIQGDTMFAHASARDAQEGTLYTAAYGAGKCAFINEYGINDISTSTYATAADLYAAMSTWRSAVNAYGSGARTILQTIVRSNLATAGAKETFRTTYNGLAVANTASFDAVANVDAIPIVIGDQQSDGVHMLRAGYLKEVPTLVAAL